MAMTTYSITGGAWTAISAAGESGAVVLQQKPGNDQVVINHSAAGSGSLVVDESYFLQDNKNVITPITADSTADIWYARCSVATGAAVVLADVV